jgi:hypothetical protein
MATPSEPRPNRVLAATVVDSDPPPQSAWPISGPPPPSDWPISELPPPSAWPVSEPPPQSAWLDWDPPSQGSGAWPTRKAPQRRPRRPTSREDPAAQSVQSRRPVGRWIVAGALWAFAGGVLAGAPLTRYVDRGVEVGMDWLATRGPDFLRPYLPKPIEQPTPLRHHLRVTESVAAKPPAAPEVPATHAQPRMARSRYGKGPR